MALSSWSRKNKRGLSGKEGFAAYQTDISPKTQRFYVSKLNPRYSIQGKQAILIGPALWVAHASANVNQNSFNKGEDCLDPSLVRSITLKGSCQKFFCNDLLQASKLPRHLEKQKTHSDSTYTHSKFELTFSCQIRDVSNIGAWYLRNEVASLSIMGRIAFLQSKPVALDRHFYPNLRCALI